MPNVERPIPLGAIPSEAQDRVFTVPFALRFDRAILDSESLNFQLQMDTFPTFSSPNVIELTRTSSDSRLIEFQNGGIVKAFSVELPGPLSDTDVTWYWRVRVNDGAFLSEWTDTQSFVVPQLETLTQAAEVFDRLADENAYTKEAKSTNMYKLLLQTGRELGLLLRESDSTVQDLVLETARDTAIIGNFSEYLGLERVATEPAVHHRWKTKKLWKAFVNFPGTEQGMLDVVCAFVAELPTILDLTATEGWILDQHSIKVPSRPELEPIIVVYGQPQKGHSFVLKVFNSWDLTFDQSVLERFINRMKPAHSQVTISYATNRNWSLRYDRKADWDLWTNSGTLDLATNPGTVRISSGESTGTLTSPVEQISGVNGYDAPEFVEEPSGQTIAVEARTSEDGTTFGAWTEINHGVEPGTDLTIHPFIQFRLTLTRGGGGDPNPIFSKLEFKGTRT